jgi:hypothetical protein
MFEIALARLVNAQGDQNQGQKAENQRGGPGVLSKVAQGKKFTHYRRLHAVIIGINWQTKEPIRYAENDAKELADVLIRYYGFERQYVRLILGEEATKDEIEFSLNQLKSDSRQISPRNSKEKKMVEGVRQEDCVVVFIATHGERIEGKIPMGYIRAAKSKFDGKTGDITGCVEMLSVLNILGSLNARHVILMGDLCYSGLFTNARSNSLSVSDLIRDLSNNWSRRVLTAGKDNQKVRERSDLKHGIFSYYLIESLKKLAKSGQPFMSADLYDDLRDPATVKVQDPTLGQEPLQGDFQIEVSSDFVFFPVLRNQKNVSLSDNSIFYYRHQFSINKTQGDYNYNYQAEVVYEIKINTDSLNQDDFHCSVRLHWLGKKEGSEKAYTKQNIKTDLVYKFILSKYGEVISRYNFNKKLDAENKSFEVIYNDILIGNVLKGKVTLDGDRIILPDMIVTPGGIYKQEQGAIQ